MTRWKLGAIFSCVLVLGACSNESTAQGQEEEREWEALWQEVEQVRGEERVSKLAQFEDVLLTSSEETQAEWAARIDALKEEEAASLVAAWTTIDTLLEEGAWEEAQSVYESIASLITTETAPLYESYATKLEEARAQRNYYSNGDGAMRIGHVALGDRWDDVLSYYPTIEQTESAGFSGGHEHAAMYEIALEDGILTVETDGDVVWGVMFRSEPSEALFQQFVDGHTGDIYVETFDEGARYNFVNPTNEELMQIVMLTDTFHASLIGDDPNARFALTYMDRY